MQNYGIIGMSLWTICSIPMEKRQYPYVETVVSNAGNDNSPLGYRKLCIQINFCAPRELAYVKFILRCR